jgi:molybdenum cofactor biosynthesis enzyme
MNKNNKLEDLLTKLFSTSGYKMVDVSDKAITHRKALASGEILLGSKIIDMIKTKKCQKEIHCQLPRLLE